MITKRIYAVTVKLTAASPRLVRAASAAAAFRHVASEMIAAELASQDALIEAVTNGVKVEEAGAEPEKKAGVG